MNRVIKQIHMYLGLLSWSIILVFGITGFWATLRPSPQGLANLHPTVRYTGFEVAPNLNDQQVANQVWATLHIPLTGPPPTWSARRDAENNLTLGFYTQNGPTLVTVLEKEKRLRIESARNSFWQFLDNLHSTTVARQATDWRVRLWSYSTELGIWTLILMGLSGPYLWLSSRPEHRLAQVLLVLGSGFFVVLYILAR